MSLTDQIKQKLTEALKPEYMELINNSHKHVGHAGHDGSGESHYQLIVVSYIFENCSKIQRHRMINNVIEDEFRAGLHAFSIKAFTPAEYAKK